MTFSYLFKIYHDQFVYCNHWVPGRSPQKLRNTLTNEFLAAGFGHRLPALRLAPVAHVGRPCTCQGIWLEIDESQYLSGSTTCFKWLIRWTIQCRSKQIGRPQITRHCSRCSPGSTSFDLWAFLSASFRATIGGLAISSSIWNANDIQLSSSSSGGTSKHKDSSATCASMRLEPER